ncbi:MAG: T9SS type A sorting domain-containing protein, partial [Flavobacteriales bacterium]
SSTTTSINATVGGSSGNITVTANNACGSSTPQTLVITVSPVPSTPGSISGSTTVCATSSQTYSISPVGGATSYTWTLPGGWTGSSTTTSINTTVGGSSGNITVTANNACGSSTAQTLNVTVNTAPATPGSISGNIIVCATSSQTYAVTAVAGATSYTWTLPGGWTGTSTTNFINTTVGASGGFITVTANNACGNSAAQTLNVTVNTIPAQPSSISGNASVCEGSSQPYSVTNDASATSYAWILPATWSGSSTTNAINSAAGTSGGTISVTANNSCGSSTSQTLSVIVNSLPTVTLTLNPTSVCVDNAVYVITGASPSGGTFSGPGVSSGSFNAATAGVGIHTVTYAFTDGNGCTDSNTDQITVNNCTDISDFGTGISDVVIYPNPFSSEFAISGSFTGLVEMKLFNSLGELITSVEITSNFKLQTSNFPAGVYFLQLENENETATKKIIKQ